MEMVHKGRLLAAVHSLFSVATLLLCILAELFVFVLHRHASLYLLPVCAMLLLLRRSGRRADINLVDYAYLKPPRRLRVTTPALLEHFRLIGCFDDGSVEFMSKVVEASGMCDETYFPPSLHRIPPSATHADAVHEAGALFFPTLDELFAKTGVPPSAVGALVVSCSGFCPAPSLAAVIVNRYGMRGDVKAFSLSGMGCSAGVVGVDVARGVLRAHESAVEYAVVVSAEIVTVGWYAGKDPSKLLPLLSNTAGTMAAAVPAKYRLVALTRTNLAADDLAYASALREEDDEGITGFTIGRGLGGVARDLLRAHLPALGAEILPWQEKLRYAAALMRFHFNHRQSNTKKLPEEDGQDTVPKPNFLTAAKHLCLPASGMPMIRMLAEGLGVGEREAEAALGTFQRFGNQSAASLWYQVAYHEAKGRVRRGDRVWQLGMGSGPKANSAVWERVAADGDGAAAPGADEGPWGDCIHRFPAIERAAAR
ncbi:3-ketoacyl-CoA synthase 4-like [Lolium perenne]|uniref:3-ketoacyl-CoA synthase 4-like n=1 Tax=Lolium perenne TaxID=4522 RepID=UPI0021EA63A2|nr:3-ketoacyl-CoA synthase 4-like [Lolium perenne]